MTDDRWIPVSERVPKDDQRVLLALKSDVAPVVIATYHLGGWVNDDGGYWNSAYVTHWRLIPSPPKA